MVRGWVEVGSEWTIMMEALDGQDVWYVMTWHECVGTRKPSMREKLDGWMDEARVPLVCVGLSKRFQDTLCKNGEN